jgi:iduronate 2-sulfatase/deleted-in-malignant-brain-tumors protein 1
MGKIFHETMPKSDPQDCIHSWSPEACFPNGGERGKGGLYDPDGFPEGGKYGLAHKFPDEMEPQLQDGNITDHAVQVIQDLASGKFGADVANMSRPFFLAVGLHKPHVPWFAPARFWDYYPLDKLPPVPHPGLPTNNQNVALQDWQVRSWCEKDVDMGQHCGKHSQTPLDELYPTDNTTISADGAAYMRQAYFATVSWTDANIGKILDAFEATIFNDEVVIAMWGDHGWHLGDNDQWAKVRLRCSMYASCLCVLIRHQHVYCVLLRCDRLSFTILCSLTILTILCPLTILCSLTILTILCPLTILCR